MPRKPDSVFVQENTRRDLKIRLLSFFLNNRCGTETETQMTSAPSGSTFVPGAVVCTAPGTNNGGDEL